ncbi:MAG: glycosyltransferase [Gemmatimonadetes bacterium]|nr:glycosyltransferase [Gemmatimonadota bacterium]
MSRLRILHCIQNLNYGGMERVLSDLVHGVDHERFDPHVLTLQYLGRYGEGLDRVATLHEGPRQGPWSLLWPRALARRIAEIGPDVVHLHSGVWFKAARASRQAGVPWIVYTEHGRVGPERWLPRMLDRAAGRVTDRVVAVSDATAEQLRRGPGVEADRLRVIRNGIDTERFQPGPSRLREELGLDTDTVLFGSVGRLEPVKAHATLFRAFRVVVDRLRAQADSGGGPDAHLVLAGDGSLRAELEALRSSLGLDDHVTFLGWWDDPEGLLRGLDVFVLSSLSEGTSISLLEAMSSGCCAVATRVGGNPHVLGPELSHRLVESEDVASIAEGLAAAALDREARGADGARGRVRVQDSFDVSGMVEAYARLYEGA